MDDLDHFMATPTATKDELLTKIAAKAGINKDYMLSEIEKENGLKLDGFF